MKAWVCGVCLVLGVTAVAGRKPTAEQEACRDAFATCRDTCVVSYGGTTQAPSREKLSDCLSACDAVKVTCEREARASERARRAADSKPSFDVKVRASSPAGQAKPVAHSPVDAGLAGP